MRPTFKLTDQARPDGEEIGAHRFWGYREAMAQAKLTTAFPIDGAVLPAPPALIVVTPDEAGDGIGVAPGNPVVTVGAPAIVGTIGTIGDQDFYAVTLVAGKTYEIGMFGKTGGPSLFSLQDSYLEIYSASGQVLGSADGGASTLVNMVNSGFDAVLTFSATTSGTYYVNARAFDNDPTVGGSTGEGVGDYDLYAIEVDPNDPNVYHPYYEGTSPLYAIDWGTQVNKVNQSVRNPDGNEGTRDTGNAQGTPIYSSLLDIPALAAAQGVNITGKNVITIYFAKAGDVFVSNDPTNPGLPPATITAVDVQGFERSAVVTALGEFSKVADVVYLEVQDRSQADFIYTSYQGTPGPGVSLLGSMSPPDESDEGLAQFNSGDERWNALNLQQGGFSYVTLIHEFGHGHGLAHPHDNGGHSGIMNGVVADGPVADYTTGDFELNQSVFTMMSYEDGWQSSPYGNAATNVGYGYLGGLMAFDIAAIQDKYGVNEEWATGDDVYTLKDVNASGTFYSSIWDGGGTDTIVYFGARDTTIDLRAATLQYEVGGGGNVSFAYGIFGGFTIANGVTIENATGGTGVDTLWGNSANNVLDGGDGNDRLLLHTGGGNDTAKGGAGNDFIYYGDALTAADKNDGGTGSDVVALLGSYNLTLTADSLVGIERLAMYTSTFIGGITPNTYNITTVDENVANGGQLLVLGASLMANETLVFNGSAESSGQFVIHGGRADDTFATGGGNDYIIGGAGNDSIYAGAGSDVLIGGLGRDTMYGGAGSDAYRYDNIDQSTVALSDMIQGFEHVDRIDLSAIDANSLTGGNDAFAFIGGQAFTGAGQLRAYDAGGGVWNVEGDIDGNGSADFLIQVTPLQGPIVVTDFIV